MKNLSFLIIIFLSLHFTTIVQAQSIPNGDFEDWIIGGGPDLWYTNNHYYPPFDCIQIWPDFQAYSGDICAMGIVDSCIELSVLYPPRLTSYDITLNSKPEALHGFYKYFPVGEDLFKADIQIFSNNVLVGEGVLESNQLVQDFTEFIIDINYTSNDPPDKAIIEFTIDSSLVDNKLHQGSTWVIDYLTFGPLSGINEDNGQQILAFQLDQNFPNPFNPSTKISWRLPAGSYQSIKVIDVLGNEVATLVNEYKPAGTYELTWNADNLTSGVYFYQLRAGDFIQTKKMILLK